MTIRNFDTRCSSLAVFGFFADKIALFSSIIGAVGDGEQNTSTASFNAIKVDVGGRFFIAQSLVRVQSIKKIKI